jgi:tRNA threonylcarbamoyladenosine biosynthesis protein TsaE
MARRVERLTRSEEETEELARGLGLALRSPLVIALDGDLGAGKTAFVRGLARGLEVATPVSSPTFALMASHAGRLPLLHFDAWMEGRERAFLADGGAELFGQGVCAIEWAAKVADALPDDRLQVLLERVPEEGEDARRIVLECRGSVPGLEAVLSDLQARPDGGS